MIVEENKNEKIETLEPIEIPELRQELVPISNIYEDISFMPYDDEHPLDTVIPKRPLDRFKIIEDGGTIYLDVFSVAKKKWYKVALTAVT